MIVEEVMVLFIEEQKCEHVANNDVEWVVDLVASHHIIPMKGLCTMYKVGEFGTMKITSSYSKMVGISVVRIKTNASSTNDKVEGCATCSKFKDECIVYVGYGSRWLL